MQIDSVEIGNGSWKQLGLIVVIKWLDDLFRSLFNKIKIFIKILKVFFIKILKVIFPWLIDPWLALVPLDVILVLLAGDILDLVKQFAKSLIRSFLHIVLELLHLAVPLVLLDNDEWVDLIVELVQALLNLWGKHIFYFNV